MSALSNLTKPQWDAALRAAKALTTCNPNRADDRACFRKAKAELTAALPADADVAGIITLAVRWDMMNAIAAVCADMPTKRIAA